MAKQDVTTTNTNNEVAVLDADIFAQDAGAGLSGISQEDIALPFIKIWSGMDDIPDDAKKGDIYNSVTNQNYSGKEGIRVLPVLFQSKYIHWASRGTGTGAPIAMYSAGDPNIPKTERSAEDNKDYVVGGNGDYIDKTAQHYVVVLNDDGSSSTALISMKSTQLKKSKKWLSTILSQTMKDKNGESFDPPSYAFVYRMKTVDEENSKGKWSGWDISLEGVVKNAEAYQKARLFEKSITDGEVTVKHTEEGAESQDIPF